MKRKQYEEYISRAFQFDYQEDLMYQNPMPTCITVKNYNALLANHYFPFDYLEKAKNEISAVFGDSDDYTPEKLKQLKTQAELQKAVVALSYTAGVVW